MKRLALLVVLVATLGPPVLAQATHYISPDVPTDDPGGSGTIFLPWDVVEYSAGVYTPAAVLTFPPNTAVDAVHKMDRPGHWLFSVEAPTELPPGGGVWYHADDVILFDGVVYTSWFDGVSAGLPAGVNVDAAFLEGDDFGDLILSFDVPVAIGAATYEPSDLVRWAGGAFNLFFDASAAGSGVAPWSNTTGADAAPGLDIVSQDVPTDLSPTLGPTTFVPGDIASWDGSVFATHDNLAGWPLSSEVDAFSCQANPGRVYESTIYPFPIVLMRSPFVPGNIVISWAPSCSSGAEDYGIYEGTLGNWTSHRQIRCLDTNGGPHDEDLTPMAASSYYIVVPHNWVDEGAYGKDHDPTRFPPRIERPQATAVGDRCVPPQLVTPCP